MIKAISKMSLRKRTWLFFILLAICVPIVLMPTLYFAFEHIQTYSDPASTLMLFGLEAVVSLLICVIVIAALFDINVARPIQGLIRDVETVLHGNRDHSVDIAPGKYLDDLPETVRDLTTQYRKQRRDVDEAVKRATEESRKQRQTLEAVLNDLYEGVIICNLNNQVLLYNQLALSMLHITGELGLGRSLFSVIDSPPLMHSLRRLRNRLAEKRHLSNPDGLTTSFVCATCDGRFTFEARMALVLDDDGESATSYVLTFEDVTDELTALGKRDRLLREATEGMRQPVANLRAAAEVLAQNPGLDGKMRARFEHVILSESQIISDRINALSSDYQGLATSHWPMADIYSANLLSLVTLRLEDSKDINAVMTGIPHWLRGDSHSLLLALVQLVNNIHAETGITEFDLQSQSREGRIHLDIIWTGSPLASALIDSWLDTTLAESIGGMSLRDIMEHHHCEMWSEQWDAKRARLRMPMLAAHRTTQDRASSTLPSRPEFYDFKLLGNPQLFESEMGERPLSELPFVIFDTETTGLKPSSGDEILAIAGVRMLNGRILTGESFAQLVNPNRTIPRSSIKFHGITDEMVKNKPPVQIVLPQFHEFITDSILVAHNAAFDMKFLQMKEDETALKFDHPVLDTMLLSFYLHDHSGDHTLDEIAKRFGVEVEGRHTAIGDALVTAGIFQRMIPMLKARGIMTLNDALNISKDIVEFRAQQAEF